MIESLLEQMPKGGAPDDEPDAAASDSGQSSEHSFLSALPMVRRIVARRRARLDSANGSDLVQDVALRLWRWRGHYQEKSEKMSGEEWKAFAARTAYNEVNRQLTREGRPANLPLEEVPDVVQPSVEGHTEVEVFSLIQQVWQATCRLSLRQRRSLLLHSQELIIYFLQIGITEKQLAGALDFSEKDWNEICDRLPMTDAEIADITEATAGSIKKARYEARVKLEGSVRK